MVNCSFLKCDFAHRGLHNSEVPENTIASFENAISKGMGIEIDIQSTKDGRIIVFHDTSLKRLCGSDANICDCDYDHISTIKLKGTEHAIPLLEDVLRTVGGRVPLLIEIKVNSSKADLEKTLLDILSSYDGEYAIQSFDNRSLKKIKKMSPETRCGLLIPYSPGMFSHAISFFTTHIRLLFTSPDFLSFGANMPENTIRKMSRGRTVLGWTVRTKEEYLRHRKKFHGLIFEGFDPDMSDEDAY